jgi:hypothetical protein
MEPNEIKAKAYIIGKQLAKLAWYDMTATQADEYCIAKAKELGADDKTAGVIGYLAMNFVLHS